MNNIKKKYIYILLYYIEKTYKIHWSLFSTETGTVLEKESSPSNAHVVMSGKPIFYLFSKTPRRRTVDTIFNTFIFFLVVCLYPFSTSQLELSNIQNLQLQPELGLSIRREIKLDDFFLADTIQFLYHHKKIKLDKLHCSPDLLLQQLFILWCGKKQNMRILRT